MKWWSVIRYGCNRTCAASDMGVTKDHKEDDAALPQLTSKVTAALVETVAATIHAASAPKSGQAPSAATRKLMLQRVSPKNAADNFATLDKYWVLVDSEITSLLDRILAYRYVTQYRKVLIANGDRELVGAWQFHSQSLRTGELYIIQDRTTAALRFLMAVGNDCGLAVTDQTVAFEKKFKKRFERRLRERHRLVHGHERPSMESRIIGLSGETTSLPRDELERILHDILGKAASAMREIGAKTGKEISFDLPSIEKMHEDVSVREARQMLDLVGEALLKTIGLVTEEDSKDGTAPAVGS